MSHSCVYVLVFKLSMNEVRCDAVMSRKRQKRHQIKTSFDLSRRSNMMGLPTKTELVIFLRKACGLMHRIGDNFAFLLFGVLETMI